MEDSRLKVAVETIQPSRKRLHIEIPSEKIQTKFDETLATLRKTAQVPGFRRQKAPLSIIRARFGDAVKTEVLEAVVSEAAQEALEEHDIEIIGDAILAPPLNEMKLELGQDLVFDLDLDVKPSIELPDPRTLEVDKRNVDVPVEEVEAAVQGLLEQRAEYPDVTEARPVASGDAVTVDYALQVEGQEEARTIEDARIIVGEGNVLPGVEDGLTGMNVGETKAIETAYPQDHGNEEIAGKAATVTVTVKKISQKILPELNDDFAKSLNYEDLDKLRAVLWNQLIERAKSEKRREQENDLMNQLREKTPVEIPEATIRNKQQEMAVNFLRDMQRSGQGTDTLNVEGLLEGIKPLAENTIRQEWILDEIADRLQVDITNDELSARIHQESRQRGEDPDKVEARLRATDAYELLRQRLRDERIFDLLIEQASEKQQLIY